MAEEIKETNRRFKMSGERVFIATFFFFALLLNSTSMMRSAENMPFDSPYRAPSIKVLSCFSKISSFLKLNQPRTIAEAIEKEYLE